MQVQVKKQLKIELDQQDIISAVGIYLAQNGISVNQAELNEINFVKSPKDGLRATLNITEESGIPKDEEESPKEPESEVELAIPQPAVTTPEFVVEPEPEIAEGPGEVDTSTVEDVMPSVDEVAALIQEPQTPVNEEEEEAVVQPQDSRKSLFG